jgi:hypothetical protein
MTFKNPAPGGPGIPPRWTRGSKDAVGTAYSTSSRLWYTLANGVVTECYYSTIDSPQVRDLQYLVSDGETFFHDERRNMVTTLEMLGTAAKPGSTESLLATCLAERSRTHQRLSGVGPAVGMSATSVVVVQVRGQACDEFLGRGEVAAFQKATSQGAEPQFDLVEPRAVLSLLCAP